MKPSILIVPDKTKKDLFPLSVFEKMDLIMVDEFAAALKVLKKRRFDICFIQVNLSKKTEFHFLKQIQKMDGSSDLLVVLEKDDIPAVMKILGNNWDYLVLPYSINELKLKLERILAKRNLERENRFWRIELAALLADRGTLTLEDIPAEIWEKTGDSKVEGQSLKRSRREFERECLRRALERARGSQTQAAQFLGIHRNTLIWKLKKLNLEKECQKIVRKRRGQ